MNYLIIIISMAAWLAKNPEKQNQAVESIRDNLLNRSLNPISGQPYTNAAGKVYMVACYDWEATKKPNAQALNKLAADFGPVDIVETTDAQGELQARGLTPKGEDQ